MKKIIYSFAFVFIVQSVFSQGNGVEKESFEPTPGEDYVISAWVQDEVTEQVDNYTSAVVIINDWNDGASSGQDTYTLAANDAEQATRIIDGWQLIQGTITLHPDTTHLEIKLVSGTSGVTYFDDVRFFPFNGNLKSFVYDPENQRLMAELDENNYATFYEYDTEGGLVRVKKETERGVKTIQETRSGNSKINN